MQPPVYRLRIAPTDPAMLGLQMHSEGHTPVTPGLEVGLM